MARSSRWRQDGTVDDNTDAWFVGSIRRSPWSCGSGSTTKRSRSAPQSRIVRAALPMWMEFMKGYIDGRPDKDEAPQFEAPGNIVFLSVQKGDGAVLPSDTPGAIREAFISGTQPGGGGFSRQQ
jgi:penicillin-binding protein 1A